MARQIHLLSPADITSAKEPKLYPDGGGLFLRVDANGSKRWTFLFQFRGKRKEMGLGSIRSVPVAAARVAAHNARQAVAAGLNPIDERRRARRTVPLFGEFSDAYIETHKAAWKNAKHLAQWKHSVEVDAAKLRKLPVDQIDTDDVLDVLKPIWATKPETAKRCQGRIARILDAAKARKYRQGENPAAWKGNLDTLLPKQPKLVQGHHPAMEADALPAFMAKLGGRPANAARALQFAILTAGRTGEVLGARWGEVDFQKAIWTVPADRMKTKAEHRVPLTAAAVDVLNRLASEAKALHGRLVTPEDFIFMRDPSTERLSNMAMAMLLRRMEVANASVHGFRSTFRDWVGQKTEFPRELAELSLSHLVGNEVERAYRRGDAIDRRRVLMDAWSAFCTGEDMSPLVLAA